MYTVEIIKKNGFDCNWTTLFIGRQFKLISSLEVTNYAVTYLENNPTVNSEDILELAWEQAEDKVDDLLKRIISDSSSEVMNKEYHKWLYSIMKEIYNNSSGDNMFRDIENIFSILNTPQNMYEFFRKVSDAFYYPSDSKYTIKELVEEFLDTEKQLILD
ncbi:DUF2247 family protein [Bacillus cereus]|uniref:DUF2247 family protein n=1 Tax=Bacillus TaxID=1386 RepID=UPI000551D241|nr:DUF2247 family protein [Bacillus sp. UNC322MFChir4.1]